MDYSKLAKEIACRFIDKEYDNIDNKIKEMSKYVFQELNSYLPTELERKDIIEIRKILCLSIHKWLFQWHLHYLLRDIRDCEETAITKFHFGMDFLEFFIEQFSGEKLKQDNNEDKEPMIH